MIHLHLAFSLLCNHIIGKYISRRGSSFGGKIKDLGHDVFPDFSNFAWLHDLTLVVPSVALFFSWPRLQKSGKVKNYFGALAIMYMCRALTQLVTQLPRAKKAKCSKFSYCNDYIFSGHTTFNLVTSYFVGWLFPIYPVISSLITIATKEHYSVDVILAWVIFGSLLFKI